MAVCAICLSALLASPASGAALAASPAEPQPTNAGADDHPKPGNHLAEWDAYRAVRQVPNGTAPSRARLDALNEAKRLPAAKSLPGTPRAKGAAGIAPDSLRPPTGAWQSLGPAPEDTSTLNPSRDYRFGDVSGRATAIAIAPAGTIYLGTAGGGVWKSVDNGASWTPLTDGQASLSKRLPRYRSRRPEHHLRRHGRGELGRRDRRP
ncbi:MAG: WD40/YVTN/BNR-like repeat-containing protein [Thermomicrobiales bacterium]